MKKFLTALLVSFAVALSACWIDGTGEKHLYGTEAKFLTVLEPHEGTPRVKSARALDENTVEVTLVDGTVDQLKFNNFYDTQLKPSVELYRNGKLLEKTE